MAVIDLPNFTILPANCVPLGVRITEKGSDRVIQRIEAAESLLTTEPASEENGRVSCRLTRQIKGMIVIYLFPFLDRCSEMFARVLWGRALALCVDKIRV